MPHTPKSFPQIKNNNNMGDWLIENQMILSKDPDNPKQRNPKLVHIDDI